jgi:hypothetical protein
MVKSLRSTPVGIQNTFCFYTLIGIGKGCSFKPLGSKPTSFLHLHRNVKAHAVVFIYDIQTTTKRSYLLRAV